MATIKDIADRLNVSLGTVSMALRNSPKVKLETRVRVQRLARAVRYRPNFNARALLRGRTFSIGVIMQPFHDPFYAELVEAIHLELKARDYVGIFMPSHGNADYDDAAETLLNRGVDGIISKAAVPAARAKLRAENVPTVYFGAEFPAADWVAVDRHQGGCLAVEHLLRLGHRKIGFLCRTRADERRYVGFLETLRRHDLPVREDWISPGPGTRERGLRGMLNILQRSEKPTAMLAHNDTAAMGAMRAVYQMHLRIPQDVAIIGFNNVQESRYLRVALTTVEQPVKLIARKLVYVVLQRIENGPGQPWQQERIEPKLIVRESCGAQAQPGQGKRISQEGRGT